MSKKGKRNPERRPSASVRTLNSPPKQTSAALVDILMPVFGEWALAEKAIEHIPPALGRLSPQDYRLLVCDNGTPVWSSQDGTQTLEPYEQAKALRDLVRPQDHFFRLEQNVGYPGAINELASRGRSPLILILTADVMLDPGAIEVMVREMDNADVGVVGMKLTFPTDVASPHGPPGTIQHAGLCFDIRGKPKHMFIGWSADNPRVNRRLEVGAVTGACLMTRRNLWTEIGGLDRRYGGGTYEDVDYCFAVRMTGRKVVYAPTASGSHLVGGAQTQGAAQGFNLALNETIFRGKYASVLAWDEWRFL